jgi:hypothetical protein
MDRYLILRHPASPIALDPGEWGNDWNGAFVNSIETSRTVAAACMESMSVEAPIFIYRTKHGSDDYSIVSSAFVRRVEEIEPRQGKRTHRVFFKEQQEVRFRPPFRASRGLRKWPLAWR